MIRYLPYLHAQFSQQWKRNKVGNQYPLFLVFQPFFRSRKLSFKIIYYVRSGDIKFRYQFMSIHFIYRSVLRLIYKFFS